MQNRTSQVSLNIENMDKYQPNTFIGFYKNKDKYGTLSNMFPIPVEVAGERFRTTEHVYQMLRFPHMPDFQQTLSIKPSPLVLKWAVGGKKKTDTHQDFLEYQVEIMEWLVRLKVSQQPEKFIPFLERSSENTLCEVTPKDRVWGVVYDKENDVYVGHNHLGKIWMKIRSEYFEDNNSIRKTPTPNFNTATLTIFNKQVA